MQLKTIELLVLRPIVYLFIVFLTPYYIASYLDSYLNLPEIFVYPANLIGLVLIAVGLIIDIRSISTFATAGKGTPFPWRPPKKLVITGPYRYTRNPIYLAFVFIMAGVGILTNLLTMFLVILIFIAAVDIFVVRLEERGLEERFGKIYLDYKKKVPRWIPNIW